MDRNLQAFLAIAKEENLSAAAERIGLTQPSLTKRLVNLEEELGAPLFERHRRGMRLTVAGRRFLARAQRIETEYNRAYEELSTLMGMGLATLRVGAGPLYHLRYATPLFARLRQRFPDLSFELIADQNAVTLAMLRDERVDVVLGAIEPLSPSEEIEIIPVSEIEHSVMMPADDPLARKATLAPEDLEGQDWVAYQGATDNVPLLRKYFTQHKLSTPSFVAHSTSFSAALDLTRAFGAKLMAPLQLADRVEEVGLVARPTNPPISRMATGAYVRKSSLEIPVIRQMLIDLKEVAGAGSRSVREER